MDRLDFISAFNTTLGKKKKTLRKCHDDADGNTCGQYDGNHRIVPDSCCRVRRVRHLDLDHDLVVLSRRPVNVVLTREATKKFS